MRKVPRTIRKPKMSLYGYHKCPKTIQKVKTRSNGDEMGSENYSKGKNEFEW